MSMINPCKNCNNRSIHCHGQCKSYHEWREWHDSLKHKKINEINKWKAGYYHD